VQRRKIAVVGAGNVGAATAHLAALRNLGDIVLVDVVKGLAEGKALDIRQSAGVFPFAADVTGTADWEAIADSDVVFITAGVPRKPGMSRDDLVGRNTEIVRSVAGHVARLCPRAFVIVVCNPLDAMTYAAAKVTGFDKCKVAGMAGVLDSARFASFIARELHVDVGDVQGVLMGGHGDDMVPLPRYTCVAGVPVTELIAPDRLAALVDRTRKGGIEIVNLLGYSAYYAPAAGAVKMAEAVVFNQRRLMSCCAWCRGEYGIKDAFVGVPVILGSQGVEKVVVLDLTAAEREELRISAAHVQELVVQVDKLLA